MILKRGEGTDIRAHKYTVITSLLFCIICLLVSIVLEFEILSKATNKTSFYINISLGLFSSSFLVMVVSLIAFFHEKRKYHLLVFREILALIAQCKLIVNALKNRDGTFKSSEVFERISNKIDTVSIYMWEYTPFISRNEKDQIIDTALEQIMKFMMLQNVLLQKSQELSRKEISLQEYNVWFSKIAEENAESYDKTLSQCEIMVQEKIKFLVKDRVLKSTLEKSK
ncbi:hypothetical protein AMS62_23825 [Bacillus sp. FJAT-18019]|nr:hypothetical protein AMS62_23825 [Bacillus sp. FJAT-18019]